MSWSRVLAAAIAITVLAGPASAFREAQVDQYEVRLPEKQVSPTFIAPTQDEAQRLLPALDSFRAGTGSGWKLMQWDPALGTPVMLAGPAIPLVSNGASEQAIRAGVEAFVARNQDLLKVDLRNLRITDVIDLGSERTYVIFTQYQDGIEVIGGRLDVGLWRGQIVLLSSEYYAGVSTGFPALTESMAAEAAHTGIPASASDAVDGTRLVILPIHADNGVSHHLAWEVMLRTAEPHGAWRTYVNAADGSILWRENQHAYYQLTGTVKGQTEQNIFDPYFEAGEEDLKLTATGNYTGYTDESGNYVVEVPANTTYAVTAKLEGRYATARRSDGVANAIITQDVTPGAPVEFMFDDSNSHPAERDAYYHVNVVHDWIKGVDPTFNDLDYMMYARVNITSGTCNAYWDGASVNFYKEGGGCNNIGRISDVIYHEYQHGVTQELYYPTAPPNGSGMNEAFSDVTSMTINNDPIVGENFQTNGGYVRNGMNTRQYGADGCGGEIHCKGEVLMGAMWKTRVGFAYKYANVNGVYDPLFVNTVKTKQNTMPNFLNRLLMNNDTDGDLTNGTTDWFEICDAFAIHNLPCPPLTDYVTVTATDLDDPGNSPGGYHIVAVAQAVGGSVIDPNGVKIYWTIDDLAGNPTWNVVTMSATGNPNEYAGNIPSQQPGEYLKYYVRAQKLTGEFATAPNQAPYRYVYDFMTGDFNVALNDNLETDLGWTIEGNATAGTWERVDPAGKTSDFGPTQPEDDHTASGTTCYVTDGRGGLWSAYDVDGGVTAIVSPVFDWHDSKGYAHISFWNFFFDYTPTDDAFRWSVSYDGGTTWTELGQVTGMDQNAWTKRDTYFAGPNGPDGYFTNQMRFKISMEDLPTATTCAEAAVDDIEIRVNAPTVDVDDAVASRVFQVDNGTPNPFSSATTVRFSIPGAERVRIQIYDAAGREVRSLLDERRPAGQHSVVWDGRDDQKHPVGSGAYYYVVTAGENSTSRKVMVVR